jgi:hypothetical protein
MGGVGAGGAGRNCWGLIWFFPPLPHCIWFCIKKPAKKPLDFEVVPSLERKLDELAPRREPSRQWLEQLLCSFYWRSLEE